MTERERDPWKELGKFQPKLTEEMLVRGNEEAVAKGKLQLTEDMLLKASLDISQDKADGLTEQKFIQFTFNNPDLYFMSPKCSAPLSEPPAHTVLRRLSAFLARFSYKPNTSFKCRHEFMWGNCIMVDIEFIAPNAELYPKEVSLTPVHLSFRLMPEFFNAFVQGEQLPTELEIRLVSDIRARVIDLERHETDEFLRFDSKRLHEPHPSGPVFMLAPDPPPKQPQRQPRWWPTHGSFAQYEERAANALATKQLL